jgi:uncharacterized protein (DUF2252 family)
MDIIRTIHDFNANREPERLAMKYRNMRSNPFVFLRATCHLFYDRLPVVRLFEQAPCVWISGDLHLENFGSYKGDTRLEYFDVNDFDEAALAPLTWELVRFLSSVLAGAQSMKVTRPEALALGHTFLDGYVSALSVGKARWIERETAEGMVSELLDKVTSRSRPQFLDSRTECVGNKRRIRIDGKKALAATEEQRGRVLGFMNEFASKQASPGFFKVHDVARRIAGNGSLGLDRFIVLVEGKRSPDANYLLDFKAAQPSSLTPHLKVTQPRWISEAHRIVAVQYRVQAVSMAFLQPVFMDKSPYVLRSLQPSEDRVILTDGHKHFQRLQGVMKTMGEILAWGQLRSGGRDGSACIDELIDFGNQAQWRDPLIELAEHCADQVDEDWAEFSQAYDDRTFEV